MVFGQKEKQLKFLGLDYTARTSLLMATATSLFLRNESFDY